MAKRDPEKTAINKIIDNLTEELNIKFEEIPKEAGIKNAKHFNALYGSKHADYIDIKNAIINSPVEFISLYLEGFENYIKNLEDEKENSNHYRNFILLKNHLALRQYLAIFLERTYYRNYFSLIRKRPLVENSEVWIGQENANYGLLITPRFRNGKWENDQSEIRHFKHNYWTIGHVLETGLVIPNTDSKMTFTTITDFLNFYRNVIIRNSGSEYEMQIADMYIDYVNNDDSPLRIPLLIPEYRYEGINKKHKYRLDFCIINSIDLTGVGFELSPWSTHGYLSKTKELTQEKINEMAKDNFEKEMKKHKDYFRKHSIFTLIYTDSDLTNISSVFNDMQRYLVPQTIGRQIKFTILNSFFEK